MIMSFSKVKRSDLKFGDELGRGGSSTVYRATWKQSLFKSQDVAAKKLLNYNPNELEIAAKLDHANVVKLIGVVDEKPDFYLILELCKGGSLRSYLDKRQGRRLPDEQFYDWAKQAARALEYLKKMGVVHKDVKAENYVIADNDILKLTDFGLAKEIDVTKFNATGSGTYGYMAPELMKDFILSPTYDIFSFGVVIWELQTTEKPFKGEDQHAIIWKVCKHNEHPPIPAECPQLIADLIRQCWLVDWKKRPQIDQVLVVIIEAEAARALRQRQLLIGPWELERKIGVDVPGELFYPYGVAVNPANGDICATSMARFEPSLSVQLYSAEGHHKLCLDITKDVKSGTVPRLWDVTASRDGSFYFVTCSQYVRRYDVNGLYRSQFVAISPQGKPSDTENTKLRGLAIDANDQLLVGEVSTKYISKHQYDGSHVASFKVDIAPMSLEVTSQGTIVISDWYRNFHIVDNVGQLLHAIKSPAEIQEWSYRGIACYGDFICICNGDSERICCFSSSGEYLGSIPVEIPGRPMCFTFTADGQKLLVTYWSGHTGLAVYRLQV